MDRVRKLLQPFVSTINERYQSKWEGIEGVPSCCCLFVAHQDKLQTTRVPSRPRNPSPTPPYHYGSQYRSYPPQQMSQFRHPGPMTYRYRPQNQQPFPPRGPF